MTTSDNESFYAAAPANQCEECSDEFEDGEGCKCDGHSFCAGCYVERCPACKADLIDSMRSER